MFDASQGSVSAGVNALGALRGLHAGAGAGIEPLTGLSIGAGLLVAALLVFATPAGLFRLRAVRRATRTALAATRDMPVETRLAEQAKVLRRVGRTLDGEPIAPLRDEAWLARLDHLFRTRYFTQGEGRCFAADLYRPDAARDPAATARRLENLARRLRP